MDGSAGPAQQPHDLPFQFSPILIGLFGIIAGAVMVATYQCIAISCHNNRRGPGPVLSPAAFRRDQEARRRARPSRPGIARALHLLPAFVFGKGCEEGTCAVCLGEFGEGEELRRLPRCDHVFHAECVDMWLFSHASCPLCRAEVAAPPVEVVAAPAEELPV